MQLGEKKITDIEHVIIHPFSAIEYIQSHAEFYYFIKGGGYLLIEGVSRWVGEGDLVIAPSGKQHKISNSSGIHPLEFFVLEGKASDDRAHGPVVMLENVPALLRDIQTDLSRTTTLHESDVVIVLSVHIIRSDTNARNSLV